MVTHPPVVVELSHCRVDLRRGVVVHQERGDERTLSTREVDLLRYLASRPAQVVTRDELLTEVWGYSDAVVSRACDSTVSRLRAKIGDDSNTPTHLITIHGAGYRFEPLNKPVRIAMGAQADQGGAAEVPLQLGPVSVELRRQRVVRPDGEAALTGQDAQLLGCLVKANGAVVDRTTLEREVWGRTGGRALDNAVRRLRIKIELTPDEPRYLLTARGGGYQLRLPEVARPTEPRSPLIGRHQELDWLDTAMAASRWVVIVGPGGVGKTRLARQAAVGRSAPPTSVWVDLIGARTGADLLGAVATSLGLEPDAPAANVDDVLGRAGRMLLVLDNLEGVPAAQFAEAIPRWLDAAPELRLLGTSRIRPGLDGERSVELEGLPIDQAVELFVEKARSASSAWALRPRDRAAVAELVERLDRLPLSIELAAARVPALGPVELLARMERRLDLLARPSAEVERHRSLRAALSGSVEALEPADRAALQLLGLFGHGFDADDAEGLLGDDGLHQLQVLRDHSLVHTRVDEERPFRLYEAIRLFAAELRAEEPDGGRSIERAWGRWLAGFADPDHLDRLLHRGEEDRSHRHAQRLGDIEEAADLALRWDDADLAAQLVIASAALREIHGPRDRTLERVHRVVALPDLDPERQAAVQAAGARLLRLSYRSTEGLALATGAVSAATGPRLQGRALFVRGQILGDLARLAEGAADLAAAADRLAPIRADEAALARAEGQLLTVRIEATADGTPARLAFEQAEKEAIRSGNLRIALVSLETLARFDLFNGGPHRAVQRLEQAVDLAATLGLADLEGAILDSLLLALRVIGDRERFERATLRALALGARTGSASMVFMVATHQLAQAVVVGDPSAAWEAARRAREARVRSGVESERFLAWIELLEGVAWFQAGDPRSAQRSSESARARFVALGDHPNVFRADSGLALYEAHQGRTADALTRADRAVADVRDSAADTWELPCTVARRGLVRVLAGDHAGALADATEAAALARVGGYDEPHGDVMAVLGPLQRALA